jgi:hypothetical protein
MELNLIFLKIGYIIIVLSVVTYHKGSYKWFVCVWAERFKRDGDRLKVGVSLSGDSTNAIAIYD